MIKQLLKKNALIRGAVREYRLRTGQPKWDGLLARSDVYWEDIRTAPESGQKIPFATNAGGNLAATRMESLLAIALTLRGAEVHVLLCDGMLPACMECDIDWYRDERRFAHGGPSKRHCKFCFSPAEMMYRSLGIAIHRYSDFLTPQDTQTAEEIASTLPTPDIGRYSLEGAAVGEHALAGALRFYGRATLEDPYSEIVLRRYLKAAVLTTHVARRLLRAFDFECSVFHHGIYVPQGLIGEAARQEKVRVVNWHVAYRKKCFIFSHHDTYHHTLMSEPVATWENMAWTPAMEKELLDYLNSRWHGTNDWIYFHKKPELDLVAISSEVGVNYSKPCIGMLTNVMWDAQLHYAANAFPNMLEWTLRTIDYFARRPELQLLIRAHPAEVRGTLPSRQPIVPEIKKAFPSLPPNVFLIHAESRVSTYAAMLQCNAVIIYGTKTGVELTAIGKPVIVAGEAWIRNKGITWDALSPDDYFRLLDQLPFKEPLSDQVVQRARKYAYHFFFRRMIPLDFPVVRAVGTPGYRFQISRIDQLMPGSSRGLEVICNGILNGTEFIYPAEQQGTTLSASPESKC